MFALSIPHRTHLARSQAIGWASLGGVILAGSTFHSFAKRLLDVFSPLSMMFLGEFFIFFFILLSFGIVPMIQEIRTIKTKHIIPLIVMGVLASGALFSVFTGLTLTSASNAELFTRSELIFLVLFASIFLKEKITRTHLLAISIVLLGVTIVALRGFSEGLTLFPGDFLILFGGVLYSIVNTVFKKYLGKLPPELVLFSRTSITITIFFICSIFIQHSVVNELTLFPLSLLPALLGFGLIARFLAMLSLYEAVERLPITTISLVLPINIITSVSFAHFYVGEPIFWYHVIGGGSILLGTLLMSLIGLHTSEEQAKAHLKQHHRHHL